MAVLPRVPLRQRLRLLYAQRFACISQLTLLATVALAALLLGSAWLTWHTDSERIRLEAWEAHTREVLDLAAAVRLSTLGTVRGERGFLLTDDESFLAPYEQGRAMLPETLDQLETAVAKDATQLRRVAEVRALVARHLATMETMIALQRSGQHEQVRQRIRAGEGRSNIEAIMAALGAFERAERGLLLQRKQQIGSVARQEATIEYALLVIGLLLLAVTTATTIALRRSLAREEAMSAQLRDIAHRDELTGLANRRELLAGLDRMIASARATGRPLSLAIFDIDHFKRVNDTHGHPVGDEVIRAIGEFARGVVREHDLLGRLGGEEYLIAFADCPEEPALAICERLRAAVAGSDIGLDNGGALNVTLSIGVARHLPGEDRTTLIARADLALYAAKHGGRDQVRLAD